MPAVVVLKPPRAWPTTSMVSLCSALSGNGSGSSISLLPVAALTFSVAVPLLRFANDAASRPALVARSVAVADLVLKSVCAAACAAEAAAAAATFSGVGLAAAAAAAAWAAAIALFSTTCACAAAWAAAVASA